MITEGAGERSILMIHGWPDSHRIWDRMIETLKAEFRCLRFTLPGFHQSKPKRIYSVDEILSVIRQVLDHVALGDKVTLMGHDWGSYYGLRFIQKHQKYIEGFIGIDVGDIDSDEFHGKAVVYWGSIPYQFCLILAFFLPAPLGRWITWFVAKLAGAVHRRDLHQGMNYPYYQYHFQSHRSSLQDFIPDCPVLYLYGLRKPFQFHSSFWISALRNKSASRVEALNAGHWLNWTHAKECSAHVATWYKEAFPWK